MPKKDGVVQAFQFNKDAYEEMEKNYISILRSLGVKNAHTKIEEAFSMVPDDQKNGVMFNKAVNSLFKDDAERKAKALESFNKIKDNPKISPYVKAYLAEMATGFIPYDTVITAARMVGGEKGKNGKSLQMGCGEGKTAVLSTAAYAILQSEKRQVFLTSSTDLLAAEALDKIDFYELVGLAGDLVLVDSNGITRPRMEDGKVVRDEKGKAIFDRIDLTKKNEIDRKKLLKEAYSSKLVISDNITLMQDSMSGYLEEPVDKKRELLADEADFVLLDSYRPLQKTEELPEREMEKRVEQRQYAYELLEQVKKQMPKGLFVSDDTSQYVDFTQEGRKLVVETIRNAKKDFKGDLNTLYDYVYDALVVDTVYKEDRDYQILNNGKKIVSEDRASGVGIDLPQGIAQALEIKLKEERKYSGPITPEKKVVDLLNTQTFFKKYFNGTKHFISGTLGVESKEIAEELENFGVSKDEGDIYEIPPKEKRTRDDRDTKFYVGAKTKRKAIITSALKELEKGKPVLIGTVSEKEIKALKEHLKNQTENSDKKIRILEYTAASEDLFAQDKKELKNAAFKEKYGVSKSEYETYADLIKKESGKANTITLGTSIIGRGTTIKTSDEVNEAGGIHVIVDGIHETSARNAIQYLARTARGDNNGSTQIFFCRDDIPKEIRKKSYKGMLPEETYQEVYDHINARTSNIRTLQNKFVEKTEEKKAEIMQMPFLSEAEKKQAIALLSTRYFSIRNRSCGVSDRFQANIEAYEREIDAYAKLYVAKQRVTDEKYLSGGTFNEAKWLEDNGYGDIAEVHLPFGDAKEAEIYKNFGIKTSGKSKNVVPGKKNPKVNKSKTPENKKIPESQVEKYYEKNSVEMVVGEPVAEVAQTLEEPVVIENPITPETMKAEKIYGDFARLGKRKQLNQYLKATASEQYRESILKNSAITLGGLKKVTQDSQYPEYLSTSRIKALTSAFRNMITKSLQKNGKDAPIEQDSQTTPDVPEDR